MATLLKLIPPAATKAVIDYVILAHPLPAGFAAWSPVPLPVSPKARLVALVVVVLVVSVLGKLLGLSSRWQATRVDQASAGGRSPQGLRACNAAAVAPGLSAQVRRSFQPVARGCRRRGRADLQHAL